MSWCAARPRFWIKANPFAEVKGVGRKRPRGKSLGKSGNELRVKSAREWYRKALELAQGGDEGAIAALVALLLGMRAHEIVSRRVADLESYDAPGDALWIPCSKTPAGRRTLEVPDVLRPLLVARCADREPDRFLFEAIGKRDGRKPYRPYWVLRQVHRICDAAKVPRVTAH